MIVAKIQVNGAIAHTLYRKVIPAGIIGAQVELEYAEDVWKGLHKTVVFEGAVTKDVVTDAEVVTIPAEVVAKHGDVLRVGVYGVDADGSIAIPTIWAYIGVVCDSANPSGDTTTDPALPVWAQIQTMIGDLRKLDTTAKENLVAAVNEALTKGGGEVDPAEIQRIVEDYLAANPPSVTESDPTVPAWAKQPNKPTYTAEEVHAMPETYTLPIATETVLGGVKPVTATEAMTQPVGVDAEGRLMTKPVSGGSGIAVTGATVGQTVKIAAVDDNGVPTAWEPVDLPSGGGGDLQWYKVAETETTEEITEYVVSQDFDGNPIKSYNPVAIALYFATPADSTQASTNGSPWIYPSASSTSAYIRATGATIAGWKTTARTLTEIFFGSGSGIIGFGISAAHTMTPVGLESAIMDGVRILFNTSGDHFPVGTHFIVSVLGVRA